MYLICLHTDIFLLYAKLEEEHGLARHAMAVYERATKAVLPEEQYEVRNTYAVKSSAWVSDIFTACRWFPGE